jgi:hypothetical protein
MFGNELALSNARRECAIAHLFKHDNVIELYEYTENEEEFVMYMEYANDPNYFANKIVEVRNHPKILLMLLQEHTPIKN